MTDAVMFNPKGNNILPARVLYKKNILVLREVLDLLQRSTLTCSKSLMTYSSKNKMLTKTKLSNFEITLSNLTSQGEIDESDFMDRAKLLCSLGHTVMISDF